MSDAQTLASHVLSKIIVGGAKLLAAHTWKIRNHTAAIPTRQDKTVVARVSSICLAVQH